MTTSKNSPEEESFKRVFLMTRGDRFLRSVTLLQLLVPAALLMTDGCSMPAFLAQPSQVRGNNVQAYQLDQLVVGTSTRADASSLLGTPTTKATFDDDTWIYVGEVTRPVIAGTQGIRSQDVVVLRFDKDGVLRGIEHKTKADAQPVEVVSRTTPSPGSEASFMQQLLGNVGKFNAAGSGFSSSGGAGGAPSSTGSSY